MKQSKKKRTLVLSADELRRQLVQLWSPLFVEVTDFNVDIGNLDWHKDHKALKGLCLDKESPDRIWDDYFCDRKIKPQQTDLPLIIISKKKDAIGGLINTAIHEFAHIIRDKFEVLRS